MARPKRRTLSDLSSLAGLAGFEPQVEETTPEVVVEAAPEPAPEPTPEPAPEPDYHAMVESATRAELEEALDLLNVFVKKGTSQSWKKKLGVGDPTRGPWGPEYPLAVAILHYLGLLKLQPWYKVTIEQVSPEALAEAKAAQARTEEEKQALEQEEARAHAKWWKDNGFQSLVVKAGDPCYSDSRWGPPSKSSTGANVGGVDPDKD